MQKPTIEERMVIALEKISFSISSLGSRIEQLYENWKHPVMTMEEQMKPEWKEQREEKQLDLLKKQNIILIYTVIAFVVITSLIGIIDIILRIFFNR